MTIPKKSILLSSVFIIILFAGCKRSINRSQNSSIENILIGVGTLMHDGNTGLAIPKFNEDFVNVNSDVNISSVVEDYNPENNQWISYQQIESLYGENGNIIKCSDTKTFGATRKVMEEYTYQNDLLKSKMQTQINFEGRYSYFKEENYYNELGRPDSVIEYSKIEDPWDNSRRYYYNYDSLDRLAEFTYQVWSGLYNRWQDGYKDKHFYYDDSTIVYQYSQDDDKDYKLYRKTDSLFHNKKFISEIIFELDNGTWDTLQLTKIDYDKIGNKISESIYYYEDNSSNITEYLYNSNNQRTKRTTKRSFYLSDFNRNYIDEYIEKYIYNEAGYLTEINIDNDAKYIFSYDEYGFIRNIVYYFFDDEQNEYVKASRISQSYKIL